MGQTLHHNAINDNTSTDLSGGKKARFPYVKFYPEDWMDGTRHLSLEQRGAYIAFLCLMYDTCEPIRDDDRWIAYQLMTTPRRWRSIRNALVADGKLVVVGDRLTNRRAEIEIENRVKLSRKLRETSVNRERKKRENFEKENEINKPDTTAVPREEHYARATSDFRLQKEEIPSQLADTGSVAAREVSAPLPISDLKVFYDRLFEAAKPCLDNPVNCQGLINTMIPQMWVDAGCDLERDILPTLAAKAATHKGSPISSWQYFTKPVTEARLKRLKTANDMAAVTLPTSSQQARKSTSSTFFHPSKRSPEQEEREREAWARQMGVIDEHVH